MTQHEKPVPAGALGGAAFAEPADESEAAPLEDARDESAVGLDGIASAEAARRHAAAERLKSHTDDS